MDIIVKTKFEKHPSCEGVFVRTYYDNEKIRNFELLLLPGYEVSKHLHEDMDEYFTILEGEAIFMYENETRQVKKGCGMLVRKGQMHGLKNETGDIVKVFCIFTKE